MMVLSQKLPQLSSGYSLSSAYPLGITLQNTFPPEFSNFVEVAKDPFKCILIYLQKNLKNFENQKKEIARYQDIKLTSNKELASIKVAEINGSINFVNDLINICSALSFEVSTVQDHIRKEENKNKAKKECKRSEFIAKSFAIFSLLESNIKIQQSLVEGRNSSVKLKENEMELLLNFCKNCLCLPLFFSTNFGKQIEESGFHLNRLFNKSQAAVCNTTYSHIASIFSKISESECLNNLAIFLESKTSESVKTHFTSSNQNSSENSIKNTFLKPSCSVMDELKRILGNAPDPQLQQMQISFMYQDPDEEHQETMLPEKPKKVHTIEEVLADVQGEYHFLQESMLDLPNKAVSKTDKKCQLSMEQNSIDSVSTLKSNQQDVDFSCTSKEPESSDQINSVSIIVENDAFLPNELSFLKDDVSDCLSSTAKPTPVIYQSSLYQGSTTNYAKQKKPDSDPQILKPISDGLGVDQTAFRVKRSDYDGEHPNNTQYSSSLHSIDSYQNNSAEKSSIKTLPASFNPLQSSNSRSPFEGSLTGNNIPDPIPLPSNSSIVPSLDLTCARIPFPNDKLSGYRSYSNTSPTIDSATGIGSSGSENQEQFSSLTDKQAQTALLPEDDVIHLPSFGLELDSNHVDALSSEALKSEDKLLVTSRKENNDSTDISSAQPQLTRNNRNAIGYHNSTCNFSRGQLIGGFSQNRFGNYRPSHNRSYGNFDSIGHPKLYVGTASGYHQHIPGFGHFNSHFSRQDNGMYSSVTRRGSGGSSRGNRGYLPRGNALRQNGPINNYNRSRTFRPQNSEQLA